MILADRSRDALPIPEAITAEYVEALEVLDWEEIGDYGGDLVDFFAELGMVWTEALVSMDDLTPLEKEDCGAKLDVWWGELDDYDTSEYFGAAFGAIEQGRSYPPLVKVLKGIAPDDEFSDEMYEDPLTLARLNVLERRGRHEEYLNLSEAAGATTGHAIMLVRLGRAKEAVEYSLVRLADPEGALAVAGALPEHGDPGSALRVGEHGLSLQGRKGLLANLVRDLAIKEGRPGMALQAANTAVRADPDLASYPQVRKLAGERWPEHREKLLEFLRQNVPYDPVGHLDVFLHEGLVRGAIAVVEESPIEALVERVVDAAVESHPRWVIDTCRGQPRRSWTTVR
jgi:hypothetical protein